MNKSVLALSTALSIFMLTPAFAQSSNSNNAGTNCAEQNSGTGSTTATDPNCVNKNNATQNSGSSAQTTTGSDQQQTQSGSTTAPATGDQNASGTTGTSSDTTNQNAQSGTGTGTGATTTDQNANSGSSTTTNSNTASDTSTMSTGTSNMSTDLIVPADRLNNAKLMSANDYIGKTVYDQTGANIGEVNDMILSDNGEIQAVILGVGGFLGIGEKNVAVAVPAVQMVQDGNNMRLVVQATKDQLEAAPSYDMRNRRYATDNNATTTDTTSSTTTAPATGTDGTMNNTTGTGTTKSDGSSN